MSDESADVAEEAERAELRALLRSAVRGLGASEQDLIQLQLRQELDVAEIAAVLGVSRNHAHALLSRARAQLEVSLGALLVARSGRGDCEALGALLGDWDGQLNVLMRKRINRHIERCPDCTERKRRELAPALLLGLAPLPIAVMPPGLRTQVLRLVSSGSPGAVAHRAIVARRADMSGPGGFPKPLDPPKSAWWQARTVQGAAAAAVVVAAAVLVILAVTGAFGTHPGQLSALSHSTSSASTTAPPPPPPPGTLRVAPRTIVVSALSGASLTLTASGGPVSWSVTESSGLIGQLSVAPGSGRLLAGQSTTISVNISGGLLGLAVPRAGGGVCVGCHLTINPGGIVVSVVIEVDVTPSSPPPSTKPPSPEVVTERPAARLVN